MIGLIMNKTIALLGQSMLVLGFVVSGNCFMSMLNNQTKPVMDKYPNLTRSLGMVTLYMYIVLIMDKERILTSQRVRVPLILMAYIVSVLSGKSITFWVVSFLVNALAEELEYQKDETQHTLTDEQSQLISTAQFALLAGAATIVVIGFLGNAHWQVQENRDAFPWASFAGGNAFCDGEHCYH